MNNTSLSTLQKRKGLSKFSFMGTDSPIKKMVSGLGQGGQRKSPMASFIGGLGKSGPKKVTPLGKVMS